MVAASGSSQYQIFVDWGRICAIVVCSHSRVCNALVTSEPQAKGALPSYEIDMEASGKKIIKLYITGTRFHAIVFELRQLSLQPSVPAD